MTLTEDKYDEVVAWFEKHSDEFIKRENSLVRLHPDNTINLLMKVYNLIDESKRKHFVGGTSHEVLYLIYLRYLNDNVTEEDIIDIIRCGCVYDAEDQVLIMYV